MPRIAITSIEDAPVVEDRSLDGEVADAGVETRAAFAGYRAPIHMRLHRLGATQSVGWPASSVGHLAYVWHGSFAAPGSRLGVGSMVLVEHGAAAEVTAIDDNSAILVFNCPIDARERPAKAGGHVHILPAERVPRNASMAAGSHVGGALLADSACATCDLWLHENVFPPNYEVVLHLHNEDEVIVVTAGEIVLGARRYGRGTAIAIAKQTIYGFKAGPGGLSFVNFRPHRPTYIRADSTQVIDEQKLFIEKMGSPAYL
jgi:hypothetical protein